MLACSLFLHLGAALLGVIFLRPPELDIEFELPMDVEFGTSEALTATPPPVPVVAPAPTDPAAGAAAAAAASAARAAAWNDAGPPDAGAPTPAAQDASAQRAHAHDAGLPQPALQADGGALPARLPPGAQIALRVDMARIRSSPIVGDVRTLLAAIPDWKALLDGSGIDPIEQVDRLLIATPNLQREKIVLAGRYLGGEQVVRDAVDRLAAAKGESATWHSEGNVQVAPWANQDATPRVIALVGPRHFAIARAEDLPRVLAIAAVRAQRGKKGAPKAPSQLPADALLSMEENEGLSLEVEGAAQFVRRARRGIPERLRLSVIELPGTRAELRGVLTYLDAAQAADARGYWNELRARYASNTLVALLGLSAPLEDATVEQRELEVHVDVKLTVEQMRLIMGYVRELVSPPQARP